MHAKFSMIGRIGSEFTKRSIEKGGFISFSIAVERPYRNAEGKRPVDFFECKASGNCMQILENYAGKGDLIFVEGRQQVNKWVSDGQPKAMVVFNVHSVELLGKKKEHSIPDTPSSYSEEGIEDDKLSSYVPEDMDYQN
ncbi:single-stranded DNA-binding protein [Amedibacterium intestinale]|uniref:single-stranded DNA-binding protein n=1 Tax=Amedibacterium intestinale TaxID=2583452 RepID=UPI0039936809